MCHGKVRKHFYGCTSFHQRGQSVCTNGVELRMDTAFNPTNAPTVFVATFFDAPAEGLLLIPGAPGGC